MHPQSRTGVSVPRPPSDNINWGLDKMGAGENGGWRKWGLEDRAQKKRAKKGGQKKGGALFHLLIVNIFAFFFGENLFVTIFSASAVV